MADVIEWHWDATDQRIRFIDYLDGDIVNETGIPVVRVIRLYQTYFKRHAED